MSQQRARIIGAGRAGGSFAGALAQVGWQVDVLARNADVANAADDVDLLLITTPDAAIASVAGQVNVTNDAVIAHASGSLGLEVLVGHKRRAGIHPLISLSNAQLGAARLLDSGWFAVVGDPLAASVVAQFGGQSFQVSDSDRATYHAAACVASPHLVALLGQVERLAASIGVPAEAFWSLSRGSLDNVAELGAAAALTGPSARGDDETIARHLGAIPPEERATYEAMVNEATRLANAGD